MVPLTGSGEGGAHVVPLALAPVEERAAPVTVLAEAGQSVRLHGQASSGDPGSGGSGGSGSPAPPADTDGDGLTDDVEVAGCTDPANADTDGDGASDGAEVAAGTDPCNPDTDGDGVRDGFELVTCLDPLAMDTDADGLRDGWELNLYGTNPCQWDTDLGRVSDGDEVRIGKDPLDPSDDVVFTLQFGYEYEMTSEVFVIGRVFTSIGQPVASIPVQVRTTWQPHPAVPFQHADSGSCFTFASGTCAIRVKQFLLPDPAPGIVHAPTLGHTVPFGGHEGKVKVEGTADVGLGIILRVEGFYHVRASDAADVG